MRSVLLDIKKPDFTINDPLWWVRPLLSLSRIKTATCGAVHYTFTYKYVAP